MCQYASGSLIGSMTRSAKNDMIRPGMTTSSQGGSPLRSRWAVPASVASVRIPAILPQTPSWRPRINRGVIRTFLARLRRDALGGEHGRPVTVAQETRGRREPGLRLGSLFGRSRCAGPIFMDDGLASNVVRKGSHDRCWGRDQGAQASQVRAALYLDFDNVFTGLRETTWIPARRFSLPRRPRSGLSGWPRPRRFRPRRG